MQKRRVCSLITALCIAAASIGVVPEKAAASQVFGTETIIETEAGDLNGVIRENNRSASGNVSVYINTGAVSKSENISLEAMSWLVNLPEDGAYRVFVRVLCSKDTRDDFWIGTNDDEWVKVSAGAYPKFRWCEAVQLESKKGIKKIKIQPAETGGDFDAIFVTKNMEENFVPPEPFVEQPETGDEVTEDDGFDHNQEKIFEVSGTGIQLQSGEASYTSAFSPGLDRNAADMDILKAGITNSVSSISGSESPHWQLEFKVKNKGTYCVWARFYASANSNDSVFYSFGDNDYKNQSITHGVYKWYKFYSGKLEPDTVYKFRLRSRESGCCFDNVLITSLNTFTPTGRYGNLPAKVDNKVEKLDGERYDNPLVYPPANEHPRVLFRASDIPRILANMDTEQNAEAKSEFERYLSEDVDMDSGEYTVRNMMRIQARAFDYAINGNKENGIIAKNAIIGFLQNNSLSGQAADAITRKAGHAIYTAAEVYDWCFDLLTPAERTELISQCTALASGMEMGWPPSGQGAQAGHGGEAQLLRDFMALAIATYDERPDLWNFIGGRYYEDYIPVFNFWRTTMYQGSSYGDYRQMWSSWSYLLIKGMGAEVPMKLETLADAMLWNIYYRRPDGQMLRDGDGTHEGDTMWSYWSMKPPAMLNAAMLTGDRILKRETARQVRGMVYSSNSNEYGDEIPFLIFNDPEIEPVKDYSDLPLSKYFETPHGIMVARTSWEDGVESPTVVARMKVGEYQTNNHQHLDAGEFQIYYKGILACDSGVYQGLKNDKSVGGTTYGSAHMNQYMSKTIAHNCMLVFDPSEGDTSSTARATINDGGQRAVHNGGEFSDQDEDSHVANVESYEIDPTNKMEPNYSYLKGDLTNAYSDKVSDYKRSFMFLNLKNEKVPAAMIVFDKIDSSNASFKKTWLLHSLEEPTIEGTRTVLSRTYHSTFYEYGYNGKLTLDTLLPAASEIKKVGGEDGWSNVNGYDYTGYPKNSPVDEGSTWRVEVSPANASKGDYFLNVMQVSDNDKSEYLPVSMVENDLFYGAKISDRVVMFSKSGERADEGFSFEVEGAGELQYTICDVAAGTYSVKSDDRTQIIEVSENGGVLAFTGKAGKITVESTDEQPSPVEEVAPKESAKDTVQVRIDGVFVYNKVPAVLHNNTVLINADEIGKHFGVKVEKTGDTVKFSGKELNVEFALDSTVATANSEQVELSAAPELNGDTWMVPARAAVEALDGKIKWDRFSNTVYISLPEQDLSLPEGYALVAKADGDEGPVDGDNIAANAIDADAGTIWASNGVGRYMLLELDKLSYITNVEVLFNPNSARNANFAIEVSEDGKNFTRIYEGTSDGSVETGTWEKFEFDKAYQAKYIKYVGNGSNISNWNAIQEIRFKLR